MKSSHKLIGLLVLFLIAPLAIAQYPPKTSETLKKPKAVLQEETAVIETANTDKKVVSEIEWLPYEKGLRLAEKLDMPVVIDFTASWCGWCRRMEKDTFTDKKVIEYMGETFIAIKVWGDAATPTTHDGEKMTEKDLARLFAVRGYPTFWFLESNGSRIGPVSGYKKPNQFLPLIEYVGGNHYK